MTTTKASSSILLYLAIRTSTATRIGHSSITDLLSQTDAVIVCEGMYLCLLCSCATVSQSVHDPFPTTLSLAWHGLALSLCCVVGVVVRLLELSALLTKEAATTASALTLSIGRVCGSRGHGMAIVPGTSSTSRLIERGRTMTVGQGRRVAP